MGLLLGKELPLGPKEILCALEGLILGTELVLGSAVGLEEGLPVGPDVG